MRECGIFMRTVLLARLFLDVLFRLHQILTCRRRNRTYPVSSDNWRAPAGIARVRTRWARDIFSGLSCP